MTNHIEIAFSLQRNPLSGRELFGSVKCEIEIARDVFLKEGFAIILAMAEIGVSDRHLNAELRFRDPES